MDLYGEPLTVGAEALYIYPLGDADVVTVLAIDPDAITIRFPNGRRALVNPDTFDVDDEDF